MFFCLGTMSSTMLYLCLSGWQFGAALFELCKTYVKKLGLLGRFFSKLCVWERQAVQMYVTLIQKQKHQWTGLWGEPVRVDAFLHDWMGLQLTRSWSLKQFQPINKPGSSLQVKACPKYCSSSIQSGQLSLVQVPLCFFSRSCFRDEKRILLCVCGVARRCLYSTRSDEHNLF